MNRRILVWIICVILSLSFSVSGYADSTQNSISQVISDALSTSQAMIERGTLTVEAKAIRTVMPDTAFVSFRIVKKESTQDAALKSGNTTVNDIIKAVGVHGVGADQITTGHYTVSAEYADNEPKTSPIGYRASIQLNLKVNDFELLNNVIDAAISAGASTIHAIEYKYSKQNEIYMMALTDAIIVGQEKAMDMAEAAGVEIVYLEKISEHSGMYGGATNAYLEMAQYGTITPVETSSDTQVLVGHLEVEAYVLLIYRTK